MTVCLITWNVQWFCGLDYRVDVDRVIDHARTLADFDVLCLQEVAVDYPGLEGGAGFDQVQRVRERLPGFEVHFGAAVQERGRDGRWQMFGNLVASRLPVAQAVHQALPYPADGGVRSMPRMCTSLTLQAPWGPLRVMTTHLEFYSPRQRMAQAQALVDLHRQACGHAGAPPADDETGGPFQNRPHAASALLCGDFNLERHDPEYALIQQPVPPGMPATQLLDVWPLLHGNAAPAPTFRIHDRRYGPVPITCDFIFASADLAPRLDAVSVDTATTLSDHQPVLVRLRS
ncbi:MAG: endonuclease/exonuclease/phosphatase family protein [Aquabacterium sp.]